jgi:hypothetical protein
LLLVPLAVVPAAAALAHGCSNGPSFESVCDWLNEQNNCLQEFHQDAVADKHPGSANNPNGDCRFLTVDGGSPTEASSTAPGISNGTFPPAMTGMPATYASCVIYSGGTVTFNPPLNPATFPPAPDAGPYMITLGNSNSTMCGTVTYGSQYDFSIAINPVPPTDGGPGAGGAGSAAPADAGYGTFTESNTPGDDAFTVTCPSGETHLLNLDEIIGSTDNCPTLAGILPQASLQVFAGGIDAPGGVSFAIVYPPLDAGAPYPETSPVAPDRVVYFNCAIPPLPETCHDGVQNGLETDTDCGGPQMFTQGPCGTCPVRCGPMAQCRCDADCETDAGYGCALNAMSGMLQCTMGATNGAPCSWTDTAVGCSDAGAADGG